MLGLGGGLGGKGMLEESAGSEVKNEYIHPGDEGGLGVEDPKGNVFRVGGILVGKKGIDLDLSGQYLNESQFLEI